MVEAVYDYTDEAGNLLYQIERRIPKTFKARRPDGRGGYVYGIKGVRRVLYNLPAVLKAQIVFVTEGEKDADSLMNRGLTATTCVFGAERWRSEYSNSLKGKEVIIIPDRDEAGVKHRDKVARSLMGKAASIKSLDLPAELNGPPVTEPPND
jgi:hypothetical protein